MLRSLSFCLALALVGAGAAAFAGAGPAPGPGATPWGERFLAALQAVGGGVLLGLTPSALALSLTHLGSLRDRSRRRHGLGLVAGSVAALWALAAVALALERGSRPVAWGVQLQEPAVVVLLALASLALSLGLWGLLPRPRLGRADPLAAESRPAFLRHSFLPGMVLVPFALPWTPPLVTGPVGLALQGSPASVLTVATCLGLGLAVPSLVAGLVAGGGAGGEAGSRSPAVRGALGFLPLLTLIWLLYALGGHLPADRLAYVQLALLAVALCAWLGRRAEEQPGVGLAYALAAALAAVVAVGLAAGGT